MPCPPHRRTCGCRDDVALRQQYIVENVRTLLGAIDPMPYYENYGNDAWAAVKAYLDTVVEQASAAVSRSSPDVGWSRLRVT